jgi:hypothetical protein
MPHHGPDPSEALPLGEETLTPEQLGRLATALFELQELFDELNDQTELTTVEYEAVQLLRAQAREIWENPTERLFQILKDGILHPPE